MKSAVALVLDTIAHAVLGDADDVAVAIGTITLRPHQREALVRLRGSIANVGGALLADEPGLGKTFVALALARELPPAIVVAPAALRATWHGAAATAGVETTFISMEALSRRVPGIATPAVAGGLVIVDEAHHACNPATARYARLARLTACRRVLLLSATPVRNRRAELSALLALFMGPRAYTLGDAERSRCIVRRSGDALLLPRIDGPHWHRVPAASRLRELIAALPPPLPALDGRAAVALLTMSLARCWASSLAALDAALLRRMQRGAALDALLDDGRVPTRDELRAWAVGDDAVQLAFPIFASHKAPDAVRLRAVLEAHLDAVRALRARIRSKVGADSSARARLLVNLRRAHAGARIVAFTGHAATAEALYRALAREGGVALLTARGARTAGGARPRSDVIDALGANAPTPGAHDAISLVITTDLLSEGVNLQGASVIVHLDTPWTPAGLAQRVGRAARMGSRHNCVHVHGIATPSGAEHLMHLGRRLVRKHAEQDGAARSPGEVEELRAIVRTWRGEARSSGRLAGNAAGHDATSLIATATGMRRGFIGVVEHRGERTLVCGVLRGNHRWTVSDAPVDLRELARAIDLRCVRACVAARDGDLAAGARVALERWLTGRRARESGGNAGPPSRERRMLLGRLNAAVRTASVHSRATHARDIARVRALISRAVSAGAERTLGDIARSGAAGLPSLLAACDAGLADLAHFDGAAMHGEHFAGEQLAVRALLLLQHSS